MRYLIIGGGIAGTTAAEELRKIDAAAEITIIDHEDNVCYSRVLLPHYVKGVVPREKVFLRKPEWYGAQRIEAFFGTIVMSIDTKNKHVVVDSGREIPYDVLLITTGGEVNTAPEDMRGVSYLHTLGDADHFLELLREVTQLPKEEQCATVLGGGFIALEYINIFSHFGIPTTVIKRSSGFWSRTLSEHAQAVLANHATSHGVTLLTNELNPKLEGKKTLESVVTASGKRIPTRILGVGIGIHADTALFIDAGIFCGEGILASSTLETNVDGVYTAGDVAEPEHPLYGRPVQIGNWQSAQMQGRAVAKTMSGASTVFEAVTSYATNLLGMHVVFVGDTSRAHAERVESHKATPTSSVDLFFRDNRIVGATLVGDVSDRAAITKAIQEKYARLA